MLFLLVVIANTMIAIIQEVRSRNTIREMKLLNMPRVSVLRNGREKRCPSEETVVGDLVILRPGDQVVADAMVAEGYGSVMESQLTGESNPVPKKQGDWLYSGSYVTEGRITAQLVYVGDESYAGGSGVEEMVLYYEHLLRQPLNLNAASRLQMEETGLLTLFQQESLIDWRAR